MLAPQPGVSLAQPQPLMGFGDLLPGHPRHAAHRANVPFNMQQLGRLMPGQMMPGPPVQLPSGAHAPDTRPR